MDDKQRGFYYITGESIRSAETSPFLVKLKKKEYEVIYLVDPIDEYTVQQLKEFEENTFLSTIREGLHKIEDEDEKNAYEETKVNNDNEGCTMEKVD